MMGKREFLCQLWGWILFIACAILFIISGIKNGDVITTIGSIFFFIATLFLFLSPFLVEQLKVWLNYQIDKMIAKSKVYEKKLESKIEIKAQKYEAQKI